MRMQLMLRTGIPIALLWFIVIAGIQASAAEERSGSVPRDDFRLYYRIVGASGPYVILMLYMV